MHRTPIGEVCVELKLMTPIEVDRILQRQREGQPGRFGELSIEAGLLDEDGVARALAHQFRLQLVPSDRVERLSVPRETAELLPAEVMQERLVVPTYLDADKGVLSLLVTDPTDLPALKSAQESAQAARLRLFVGPVGAVRRLVERLTSTGKTGPAMPVGADGQLFAEGNAGVVVLEPDTNRLNPLRALYRAERAKAQLVAEPNQVTPLLRSGIANQVIYRRALSSKVEASVSAWRRARPSVQLTVVEEFGPASIPQVPFDKARDFFMGLIEFALLAGETRNMAARSRVRRTVQLTRQVAAELDLPPLERDTASLAALLVDLDTLSLVSGLVASDTRDRHSGRRFELALAVIEPFDCPYDLAGLFQALETRLTMDVQSSGHRGAEVLFTVRAVVKAGAKAGGEPTQILGFQEASRHDPVVMTALAAVLRRELIRAQLARADAASSMGTSTVIVAERDAALVTALEARLSQLGFEPVVVADGEAALERTRSLQPAAVIANQRLPKRDGFSLLLELKGDTDTAEIPVFLITNRSGAMDVTRGLELGAEDVLEKPINLQVLTARLKRAVQRGTQSAPAAGLVGRLDEMPLVDLIQTLHHSGRSAEIKVIGTETSGGIWLDEGKLVAATTPHNIGDKALVALFTEREGRFEVLPNRRAPAINLRGDTDFLILEALRVADELRREADSSGA